MERIRCLESIYDELAGCAVVTIMGAVAVELYSLGHRPNFFYLEHAMGLASSMGLGIALSQPRRKVVVLDGDGSVLMNLGGLTTLARYAPGNLTHIVFDNQSLLSVGGFPTATATGSDLAGIARAAETVEETGTVGNLYVNRSMIGAIVGSQPFGGEGLSGTGPKAGGPHYVARFATERVSCIDTTAAGGNASLMAAID